MAEVREPLNHTVLAIWQAYEAREKPRDSYGISMSTVSNECERAIWYQLRWASQPEVIDGQKQRRFDTGNLEEDRLLDDLEAAGIEVERTDPATGQQFRVYLAGGWLRGKMDGRGTNIPEAPKTPHVLELKSHNDRSYKDLVKKKVKDGKPDHYTQCQAYMHAENMTRCLYLAVNKNTDELYAERIEYDKAFCERLVAKAERIIKTDKAPPRLFEDPNSKAAFACNWCPSRPQCHEKIFARSNCRTCISASFETREQNEAVVRCVLYDKELSYEEQQLGCPKHIYLPDLVPGEQIDANEDARTVTYKLNDGSTWIDGHATPSIPAREP